ncbi:MAG: hypothetical protein GY769_16395 [bacterium]|nr:hypothetical protein [bacterium]
MGNGPSQPHKKGNDRIDLNRAVQLRFSKFQDFLTEIAGNISPGGMFVGSENPQPPGEQFEFECSLADGYPLVSGRAEVVWVRRLSMSADEPCGMGVRFLDLNEGSEELIRRIVEERLKAGDSTFDLEGEVGEVTEAGEEQPSGALSDEILAAAETLVEATDVEADAGMPLQETAVESSLDAGSVTSPPEPSPDAAPEVPPQPPETDVLEVELEEPGDPVSGRPDRERPPEREPLTFEPSETAWAAPPPEDSPPGELEEPEPELAFEGTPSVPESIRESAQASVDVPAAPPPAVGVGGARSARRRLGVGRFLELAVFGLLAGVCMVLLFNQFWVRPRIEGLEARLGELTGSSRVGGPPGVERAQEDRVAKNEAGGESATDAMASAAVPDSSAAPATQVVDTSSSPRERVREVVQEWAQAWSERRVDEYLSYYSVGFVPASGVARAAWEDRRRERLLNQGAIRVTVVSLEVQETSPNEMRVTFTQSYQSDTFRDRVRKTLRMVREDDAWKIAEEIVIRQLPW